MNKLLALLLATAFTSSIAATSPTVEVTADAPKLNRCVLMFKVKMVNQLLILKLKNQNKIAKQ